MPIFFTLASICAHGDSHEPFLLKADRCQLSQPFLTCWVVQSLQHLCSLLLALLQHVPVSLHRGADSWAQHSGCVPAVLRRGEGSLPSTFWQYSSERSPGSCWAPHLTTSLILGFIIKMKNNTKITIFYSAAFTV